MQFLPFFKSKNGEAKLKFAALLGTNLLRSSSSSFTRLGTFGHKKIEKKGALGR